MVAEGGKIHPSEFMARREWNEYFLFVSFRLFIVIITSIEQRESDRTERGAGRWKKMSWSLQWIPVKLALGSESVGASIRESFAMKFYGQLEEKFHETLTWEFFGTSKARQKLPSWLGIWWIAVDFSESLISDEKSVAVTANCFGKLFRLTFDMKLSFNWISCGFVFVIDRIPSSKLQPLTAQV